MPDRQRAVMLEFFHDTFYQRRFTFAILSDKSDLVTPLDRQIGITENSMVSIDLDTFSIVTG